ncbi:hypothetical protein J31TS4_29260 [Paenibacillus sp. J31TS4]|uniref:hypothetical protein n=1 Tax=Paenibacillus sp. J31TS4 TaxID=2807195 RepID=UPI001B262DC1|nr:hypothetical protein [Paenibacillus sp. J31TS4]GIP39646.1 hypothetical protein J31TS4_29260 [Paenibacillus sp. J31TS4]
MQRNQVSIGLILIVVAVILLLGKLGVFSFLAYLLWPALLLIPGLALHYLYFNRRLPAGVLVPGGILVTYSLLFFFCNLFGWGAMKVLWPGFLFGAAVGLYELYYFDRTSPRGVLGASVFLAVLSAVLFGFMVLFTAAIYVLVALLLVAGVLLLFRGNGRKLR